MKRIFDPQNCKPEHYRIHYPELSRIKEYNDLTSRELIFCWWFANPTSPLVIQDMTEQERVKKAVDKAFGGVVDDEELEKYLSLDFDDKIRIAVERMSKNDITTRSLGLDMVNTMFNNYKTIVESGFDKDKPELFAQYVQATDKIRDGLPKLIQMVEEGFAVSDDEKKGRKIASGQEMIKRFHNSNKEKNDTY